MSILLDGEILPEESVGVKPSATLWRGGGWFETLAVKNGTLFNVDKHVDRLIQSIPDGAVNSTDWDDFTVRLGQLAQSEETDKGRAKVVVWEENGTYRRASWIKSYSPPSQQDYRNGVSLDVQLRSHPPRWPLSDQKRTSYASVMEERRQCPGWDVLYCDLEGGVWETGVANILWYDNGTIHSPPIDGHWLVGTVLESLFEAAEEVGLDTEYRRESWDQLGSFCWVTNSLVGMLPVESIATETYKTTVPSGWLELRDRLLSDKVFPRWYEPSPFS